jgi:hypothetical protein
MINVDKKNLSFCNNSEFVFFEFLQFMERLMCQPCQIARHGLHNKQYHHHGGIYNLLSNRKKIDFEYFKIWKKEDFLSGFLEVFYAFLLQNNCEILNAVYNWPSEVLVRNKELKFEKIVLSCLFHESDFDFKKAALTGVCQGLLEEFFVMTQPSLIKIYKDLDSVWISHISEHQLVRQFDYVHQVFYPELHWNKSNSIHLFERNLEDARSQFAITLDYLPVSSTCHGHLVIDNLFKNCLCMGMLPVNYLKKYKTCLSSDDCMGRCHPWLSSDIQIPLEDWVFLYKNWEDLTCINKNKSTAINFQTLDLFYRVCKMIHGRVEGMAVEWR